MGTSAETKRWADLADLILVIGREIQFRGYAADEALPLTPSEGMVMRHMQAEPDTTFPRLTEATGLQRTNLSTVLRGLERNGLVERRITPEDRRAITVHRTERGRRNYEIVRAEWGAELASAVRGRGATPAEVDATIELLRALKDGMVSDRPARGRRDNS